MNTNTQWLIFISLAILAVAFAIGFAVNELSDQAIEFTLATGPDQTDFWTRFYYIAAVSVLVERSVEVYLKVTDLDGKKTADSDGNFHVLEDASKQAAVASIIISLLLAFVGLRMLEALLVPAAGGVSTQYPFTLAIFFGVDVLVSAGLMAGGAAVFHPLAKALTGFFSGLEKASEKFNRQKNQADADASTQTTSNSQVTAAFSIKTIDDLGLAEHARTGAEQLLRAHPQVVFTSGRRDVGDQANAMAGNVVKNRQWIEQTYVASNERTELQNWVNNNPQATTQVQIASGIAKIMVGWTDAQKLNITRHMIGLAFDVAPISGPVGEQVKKTIENLPNKHKFLTSEGGLNIWHVQFNSA
ncbi:MAG: hypothetical protein ABJO86_13215 [Lentilitoribacter sp.]